MTTIGTTTTSSIRTSDRSLPQGSLELLHTDTAAHLLTSDIYARLAFTAMDGTPRIVPTWFHWNGTELVLPTFVSAPHVRHPATRLRALRAHPNVAVTIDTNDSPPHALSVRGAATVVEHAGVLPEYELAARRYLGDDAAEALVASIDHPATVMARVAVAPTWVGLIDFDTRLPDALGGVAS